MMKVVRLLLLIVTAVQAQTATKIWDQAPHNAFTDLARFKDRWWCVFREGTAHVSPDGAIRVLTSTDGVKWESAARVEASDADLRDPKITVTPKGELMLTAAGAMHSPPPKHQTYAWFSKDGKNWGKRVEIGERDYWLWRVTWYQATAYGVGYPTNGGEAVRFYRSRDGKKWEVVNRELFSDGFPNESAIAFDADGTMLVLLRRDKGLKTAVLGRAKPPYVTWRWTNLGTQLGGPNLTRLPDGRLIAAGRLYDGKVRTSICEVINDTLNELLTLPSGGDTSYPGLVYFEGELWVSYYSSHEGKTAVYFARAKP
jgi:hypothetical protein